MQTKQIHHLSATIVDTQLKAILQQVVDPTLKKLHQWLLDATATHSPQGIIVP